VVKLTQPELKAMLATEARRRTHARARVEGFLRRLGIRLEKSDEHECLSTLNQLLERKLLEVGRFTYGVPRVLAFGRSLPALTIGAFCSIADGVTIVLDGNHRSDWVSTYPFRIQLGMTGMFSDGHPASRGPVIIGNDVWLSREAMILSGVTIGDGAVVGARAVVSRDVAPYSIVVGNPARHVRYRFSEAVISELLQLRWWDWPESEIRAHIPLLCSDDVFEFLSRSRVARSSGVHEPRSPGDDVNPTA
jgi:chloramphenicol O-acetyltransferase type B